MHPSRRFSSFPRVLTIALAVALTLGACSGGDSGSGGGGHKGGGSGSSGAKPRGSLSLELGGTAVASAGSDLTLDSAIAAKALEVANSYVDAAVIQPILTGKPAKSLDRLFGIRVITRVEPGGADRSALTDEGVRPATANIDAEAKPVRLDALAGPDGAILMIGARLDVNVGTTNADGPLTVHRTGSLILEPTPEGKWQITGYDIEVRRSSGAGDTTTTASTGPSPTEAP